MFFSLGICVSYDRLLRLTSDISNGVCEQFTIDGIVFPPISRSTTTLPVKYTNVLPASIKSKEFIAPMVDSSVRSTSFQVFTAAKMGELNWLETMMTVLKKEQLDKMDWIS